MKNEFKDALELLNSCIGSIECEVTITSDEGMFADSLYYRCRAYMEAYDVHHYLRSSLRRG